MNLISVGYHQAASEDVDLAERVFAQPGVLTAMLGGCLVLGVLGLVIGRAFRWRPWCTGLAGAGLAGALAVTLARDGDWAQSSGGGLRDAWAQCIPNAFSLSGSYARLNFVMLMPFAFFAVLAVRRFLPVAVLCLGAGIGIELFQVVSGRGVCEIQDMLNNTIGGMLAAVAGWMLHRLIGTGRRTPVVPRQHPGPPRHPGPPPYLRPHANPPHPRNRVHPEARVHPGARPDADTVPLPR